MDALAALTASFYTFAGGIFLVLAALERPIRGLMWGAEVHHDDVHAIQDTLKRFVHFLPKVMMLTLVTTLLLTLGQLWVRAFDVWSLVAIGLYLPIMSTIVVMLGSAIQGTKTIDLTTAHISEVLALTRKVVVMHHLGLLLAVVQAPVFLLALALG
ncbi:MAG: hypothetical protein AAGI01_07160 [Myxococcota bacterium]